MSARLAWHRVAPGCYAAGPWQVDRQHYADGPSMYVWVLTGPAEVLGPSWSEHATLAAAKQAAQDATDHYDQAVAAYASATSADPQLTDDEHTR